MPRGPGTRFRTWTSKLPGLVIHYGDAFQIRPGFSARERWAAPARSDSGERRCRRKVADLVDATGGLRPFPCLTAGPFVALAPPDATWANGSGLKVRCLEVGSGCWAGSSGKVHISFAHRLAQNFENRLDGRQPAGPTGDRNLKLVCRLILCPFNLYSVQDSQVFQGLS
jgi:hypothetical protein